MFVRRFPGTSTLMPLLLPFFHIADQTGIVFPAERCYLGPETALKH
jgi:hypothetical protein